MTRQPRPSRLNRLLGCTMPGFADKRYRAERAAGQLAGLSSGARAAGYPGVDGTAGVLAPKNALGSHSRCQALTEHDKQSVKQVLGGPSGRHVVQAKTYAELHSLAKG